MTGMGQDRQTQHEHNESAYPLIADMGADIGERQRSASSGSRTRSRTVDFAVAQPPASDPDVIRLGRIEARIGLRMMPTFPRSPLSFRKASFPQYGWKAGCPSDAFLDDQRLKPAPGIRRPPSSLHPLFVHFVVASIIPYCAGSRTR